MKEMKCYEILKNPGLVPLSEIPALDYSDFMDQTFTLLRSNGRHCVNYFTCIIRGSLNFYILIADDDSHKIYIYSHHQPVDIMELDSISTKVFQLHIFEREISENTGIIFKGHPWLKPVRYPHNRKNTARGIKDYPFYKIDSDETHEVGVGPIHAGIIEPGHFRFICYGEHVIHLEIQLGYQHRGIESLFLLKNNNLQRSVLSESIAGDTAAGHGLAFSQLAEELAGFKPSRRLEAERVIAIEMERMAIHIGDMASLCGDVAYQVGQVACEALRTIVINTMQDWCGNRFAKGLLRPAGTNYPLSSETAGLITERLSEANRRFMEVTDLIFNNSGVMARFENTGTVSQKQVHLAGAVGMVARSAGISRDIRRSHPFQAYSGLSYKPALLDHGDVYSRALLRKKEFELSLSVIKELAGKLNILTGDPVRRPEYNLEFIPESLCVSLVEGWRGEICHLAITGNDGNLEIYKVKDPSVHNWHVLSLAVREQEISDFPLCNKSFNLSYCGNDL